MIHSHWKYMPWLESAWPNFKPWEMACRHCGEAFYDPVAFDMLQDARTKAGVPFYINSPHRCRIWNAKVGGAPLSEHKRIAFDIAVTDETKRVILMALKDAGFTTFGFYGTFIHTDRRQGRRWSTAAGRKTWNGLVTF